MVDGLGTKNSQDEQAESSQPQQAPADSSGHTQIQNTDETGAVVEQFMLLDGVIDGKYETFRPDGSLETVSQFKMGLLDGWMHACGPDGKPRQSFQYANGVLEGVCLFRDEDGALIQKVPYKAGEIDGEVLTYDNDSIIIRVKKSKSILSNQDRNSSACRQRKIISNIKC